MRYRDLETGTFINRDPIRYDDGPNMYCYVHCNPITKFDALGLSEEEADQEETSSMDGEEASEETQAEAVDKPSIWDQIKDGFRAAADFAKGTASGWNEARSGKDAANPTTQAEFNGRKFGRAAGQGVAEAEVIVGIAGILGGGTSAGGGTLATVSGNMEDGVPMVAGGATVVIVSSVILVDGATTLKNSSNLNPLSMSMATGKGGKKYPAGQSKGAHGQTAGNMKKQTRAKNKAQAKRATQKREAANKAKQEAQDTWDKMSPDARKLRPELNPENM